MKVSFAALALLLTAMTVASPAQDEALEITNGPDDFNVVTYNNADCTGDAEPRTCNHGTVLCDKVGPNHKKSFRVVNDQCPGRILAEFHTEVVGTNGCGTNPRTSAFYNAGSCNKVPDGIKAIGFQCIVK